MIQKGTYLNVVDNSGVKQIACIHVVGGYRKRYAKLGDLIIASVKSVRFKEDMKVKKGSVVKALVVKTKNFSELQKKIKIPVKFFDNSAILLSNQNKFYGSKIFGAVQKNFRYTKFSKVISLSSGVIK